MAPVFFFICAIAALAGAVGVVVLRNPFYNVLALVVHLISLAGLFLLLRAEFVAFAQVVVYAGAVMVLYVFVVAYVGGVEEPLRPKDGPAMKGIALVFAGALFVELCIAVLGSGLKMLDTEGAPFEAGYGSPGQVGELLLTRFLLPFEAASFLLLVAAVGAVTLAKRRGGIHGEDRHRMTLREALLPSGVGTMHEAVQGLEPGREPERVGSGREGGGR